MVCFAISDRNIRSKTKYNTSYKTSFANIDLNNTSWGDLKKNKYDNIHKGSALQSRQKYFYTGGSWLNLCF